MRRAAALVLLALLASCGGAPKDDRKPGDTAPPGDADAGDPDPPRPQAFGGTASSSATVATRRHRLQLTVGSPMSTVQVESQNYKATLGLGAATAPR